MTLIKSGCEYYLYHCTFWSLARIEEPKKLSSILEILCDDKARPGVFDRLRTTPIKKPQDARRVTDTPAMWAAEGDWSPLKYWSQEGCECQVDQRQQIEACFPAEGVLFPSPQVLLANERESTFVVACGRDILLWNKLNGELFRIDSVGGSGSITRLRRELRRIASDKPDSFFTTVITRASLDVDKIRTPYTTPHFAATMEIDGADCNVSLPYGWHNSPCKTCKIEEQFTTQEYRISSIKCLMIQEDGENSLLKGIDGKYYLWNDVGKLLDVIKQPLVFSEILTALDVPTMLVTAPVKKCFEKNLAYELGIPSDVELVPYGWLDKWPYIEKSLGWFPRDAYGLNTPEPILIDRSMCFILVRCGKHFYLWDLGDEFHLYRITQSTDLLVILRLLETDLEQHLKRRENGLLPLTLHDMIEDRQLPLVCVCQSIPEDVVPRGWVSTNEKLEAFPKGPYLPSFQNTLLKRPSDCTYFFQASSGEYYLWKSESSVVQRFIDPSGLFNILQANGLRQLPQSFAGR